MFMIENFFTSIQKKTERGFTLVETLVAIFIVLIAITGPMTVAYQSIKFVRFAADRSVATMLAQDVLEYIVAKKNFNIATYGKDAWMRDLDESPYVCKQTPIGCTIDTSKPLDAVLIDTCTGACPRLSHNGDYYGYNNGGDETKYTRTVYIEENPDNADERIVWVEVDYTSGVFSDTYKMRLNIFKNNI